MNQHLNIRVTGRVQGVGFRAFVRHSAIEMGIAGFVENLDSGDVYIEAEGPKDVLERFVFQLKKGNLWSRVDELSIKQEVLSGFTGFQISF